MSKYYSIWASYQQKDKVIKRNLKRFYNQLVLTTQNQIKESVEKWKS